MLYKILGKPLLLPFLILPRDAEVVCVENKHLLLQFRGGEVKAERLPDKQVIGMRFSFLLMLIY
jgi:hypothetical protein